MRSTKNYSDDGGSVWIVGGKLEIADGGELIINGSPLTQVAHQADTSATTISGLTNDFNELLFKLKAVGIMAKK